MTGSRRLSRVSRICAGVLLLCFCNVTATDTTKSPSTLLEKVLPDSDASFSTNRTVLSKVPHDDSSGYSSDESNRENAIRSVQQTSGKEEEANLEPKNSPSKLLDGTHYERAGARSNDDVDGSLNSDSAGRKSRFGDAARETSGKSSSTKTISEDFLRLYRNNALNAVTVKPNFDEGVAHERRKNKTALSSELDISNEYEDADLHKRSNRDRESITDPTVSFKSPDQRKKHADDLDLGMSEQSDLQGTAARKDDDDAISLLNDTYVNYSHYYKTLTNKNSDSGNQSNGSDGANGNGTNFILETEDVRKKQNPKEEVEVIANVTHSPLLRIVTGEEVSGDRGSAEVRQSNRQGEKLEDRNIEGSASSEQSNVARSESLKGFNGSDSTSPDAGKAVGRVEESSDKGNKEALSESTTQSSENPEDEWQISAGKGNPSQVPKGRTITFSGVNEFPSLETKTTAAPAAAKSLNNSYEKSSDTPLAKKNTSAEKAIEQKPYPYAKTTKAAQNEVGSKATNRDVETTTEAASAFKNTIGQSESEKKFVVTEPSVVIENSIQQFKPVYYKRSDVNESWSNATTDSPLPSTTAPLTISKNTDARNETAGRKAQADGSSSVAKSEEKSKTSSTENDVPRGGAEQKEITGKDENFDVTGNGITEVSSRPDEGSAVQKQPSYGSSSPSEKVFNGSVDTGANNSSLRPGMSSKMVSGNADVQTDAEESLLIRSTFNVTEVSTEYPLIKGNSSEKKASTSSIGNSTMVPLSMLANITKEASQGAESLSVEAISAKPAAASEANSTNEVFVNVLATTLNPDDISTPVTSVEYEFVGLSDTTISLTENTTESSGRSINMSDDISPARMSTTPTTQDSTTIIDSTIPSASLRMNSEEDTTSFQESSDMETTTIDSPAFTTQMTDESHSIGESTATVFEEESPSTYATTMDDRSMVSEHVTDSITQDDWKSSSSTEASESSSVYTDEDITSTTISSENSQSHTESNNPPFISGNTISTTIVNAPNASHTMSIPNVTRWHTTDSPIVSGSSPSAPSGLSPRVISSTLGTSSVSTGMPTERTPHEAPAISPEALVNIVIEGTWRDVCPLLPKLREMLAQMLMAETDKPVSEKQVIFHQTPCPDGQSHQSVAPTASDNPLTSILLYVVDEDGKFDAEMTKTLPSLYSALSKTFPKTIRSFFMVQETDSGNAIAVVVVSSVAFICLVLLAGLLFIMRKRQTRFNYGERCRPVSLDAYSLDSVSAYNSVRRKGVARSSKRSYGNPTFEDSSAIPSHPLNFAGLSSFCNDVNAINEEFVSIPQVSAKIDELPPGAEVKNRYANVIPLPETRVPLQKLNNDPLSEYINASYVRGPKNATKYYIACQAPMESAVTDFWRMIWEQQCKVIIMLTDLVENGVEKCTEYIPPSEVTDCHRLYGDFQVTLKKRETKEKYAISTLHLKNLENNTFREVYHIWYLWPVNGVQSDGAGLIAVLLEARALQRGGPGPIVVHCSPGTGRTGTLIALDLGIRQYEITRTVDVPRVVYTIRRDRAGAVQTKEQYAFIYKALNLYATKLAGGVLDST